MGTISSLFCLFPAGFAAVMGSNRVNRNDGGFSTFLIWLQRLLQQLFDKRSLKAEIEVPGFYFMT